MTRFTMSTLGNTARLNNAGFDKDVMRVDFVMPSSTYDIREEYVIYSFDSFIADVGGFLGLLLGHSVLSMFQITKRWFIKS